MTTASLTYFPPHLIDTAPLLARYAVLTQAIHAFITAGRMSLVLRYSQKAARLVRVLGRLSGANVLTRRKLDMLVDKAWRERVLRNLGGVRKLALWEAARNRIAARRDAPVQPVRDEHPAWLYTPERLAESERLKARKRDCVRASAHPNIVRDRVKVDFDGLFRLAPLPRTERITRRAVIYTQNTISDYDWNPIPFAKVEGFGPATVWPAEFYAAMELEAEVLEGTIEDRSTASSPRETDSRIYWSNEREGDKRDSIPLLPLCDVLKPSTYRALFEDPV